ALFGPRFRNKKASPKGGFFVWKTDDRLKGSLRSIAFGINLFPRCDKTSRRKLVFVGILKRLKPVKSFHDSHITQALQVLLHSVWIQDVLDRATRISHRSRDIPKVAW
ncbi:hypothetical protein AB6C87_24520, partial [Vibrio splendidus]